MATKKLCYLDIETSGLRPQDGAVILAIGCVVEKPSKKGTTFGEFYGVVTPTELEWANASPKALEVNGLTLEVLREEGRPFCDVRDGFLRFLAENGVEKGKAQVIGQNPNFDLSFLHHFMGEYLNFIGFPWDDVIDTRDLYSILANREVVPVLKYRSSENLSQALGIAPEPWPHNALEGARVVHCNYAKMIEMGARN